ncbi:hypothetical protein FRC01_006591 [Tulasnella sp. 417]|nr:hypothetical protein FRC01_006591 [Tulasnella sp. 417]
MTYGSLGNKNNEYVERSATILQAMLKLTQGHVVDLLPSLKYLPGWFPGMGFKRYAIHLSKEIDETRRTGFEIAREAALSGDPKMRPSYIVDKLRQLYNTEEGFKDVKGLAEDEAAISNSGFAFFLEKARAELDKIVGLDRPPTFDDQQALAYLHAVVLETMRWHPVATVGLPHASLKDDTYQGYFIPKGTTVIVNSWGISRNPSYYTNPSDFNPERFLKPTPELDPRRFGFGFGRRICPGNDFAFQTVWILAASILWGFEIKMTEKDTALKEDTDKFPFEVVSRPKPFKCQFVPRHRDLKDKLDFAAV